jgi:hypothetical protein
MRAIFDLFDYTHDGKIDASELVVRDNLLAAFRALLVADNFAETACSLG